LEEKDLKSSARKGITAEKELLAEFVAGNRRAFSELMKKYRNKALNFAYRYLGDFEEAEDAAQDCFVRIYLNRERFNLDKEFEPWFYRILTNVCRDRIRKRGRFDNFKERYQQEKLVEKQGTSADNNIDSEVFAQALQKLDPSKREVIILRFNKDLSYEEIASALDISPGTVMSRLHRAKKELEKIVKIMGIKP